MSKSLPTALGNLITSLLIAAALLTITSCGKKEGALLPHPAEEMPNRKVPAPTGRPPVQRESDTEPGSQPEVQADEDSQNVSGCQAAVVAGSSLEHLCCSTGVTPPTSAECDTEWAEKQASCSLSFGERTGSLWSCGETEGDEDLTAVVAPVVNQPLRRSAPSEEFSLHSVAEHLGRMARSEYLNLQYHYLKSKEPACNFFLITALCQSGYCEDDMPWFRAAQFDDYFKEEGWQQLTLDQLKAWFIAGVAFDSVLQKDGVTASRPGHVSIPVGLGAGDRVHIAQGSLGTVTNEVKSVSDHHILRWAGGFRIFAKAAQ